MTDYVAGTMINQTTLFTSSSLYSGNINAGNIAAGNVSVTGNLPPPVGIYANAANSLALATNGAAQVIVDPSGRLLVGTATITQSSTEKFEVYNGTSYFTYASSTFAPVYIVNSDPTASTNQPYLTLSDNSGNRGGIGINYTDSAMWLSGNTGIRFRYGGGPPGTTEAMRIDGSGRLGISQIPVAGRGILQLAPTAQTWFSMSDTTAGYNYGTFYVSSSSTVLGYIGAGGGNALTGGTGLDLVLRGDSGNLLFAAGGNSERMRITSAGNVGIATTAVAAGNQLSVYGGNIQVGTTGNGVKFADGTYQSTAASGGLGIGQTWQNVTASRAVGTNYTNSTGNPIMVAMTGVPGFSVLVNGSTIGYMSWVT